MSLEEEVFFVDAHLDSIGNTPTSSLGDNQVVDTYVLMSELKSEADDSRKDARDEIKDRHAVGTSLDGDFGSVTVTERTYTRLKDSNDVFQRMLQEGVDPKEIMSIDKSLVEDKVEENGVPEDDVFTKSTTKSVRKTGLNEEKRKKIFEKCGDLTDDSEQVACLADFAADD